MGVRSAGSTQASEASPGLGSWGAASLGSLLSGLTWDDGVPNGAPSFPSV